MAFSAPRQSARRSVARSRRAPCEMASELLIPMSTARILLPSEHRRPSPLPPSFPHDSVLAGVGGISPRTELGWLRREDVDRLERSLPEYEREVARRLRVLRARPFH